MNNLQQEIYKTIDILTNEKLKGLQFDRTRKGVARDVFLDEDGSEYCKVEIDGQLYTAGIRKGTTVGKGDIVFLMSPSNNDVDLMVDGAYGHTTDKEGDIHLFNTRAEMIRDIDLKRRDKVWVITNTARESSTKLYIVAEVGGVPSFATDVVELDNGLLAYEVANLQEVDKNPKRKLEKILIYYGYPSSVGGAHTKSQAAATMLNYSMIVLGDGCDDPKHPDYKNTLEIIQIVKDINPSVRFVGYVPIGNNRSRSLSMETIRMRIDRWSVMDVDGMFFDEFGYDYKVTRERQNNCIQYARDKGLFSFANAWNGDYYFSRRMNTLPWLPGFEANPNQTPTLLGEEDYVLYENAFWHPEVRNNEHTGKTAGSLIYDIKRLYDYKNVPHKDFDGRTYFEEYGSKAVSLDGIHQSTPAEEQERMKAFSIFAARILNIEGVSFGDQTWGGSGRVVNWSEPPYDLDETNEHIVKMGIKKIGEHSVPLYYSADINGVNFKVFIDASTMEDSDPSKEKRYILIDDEPLIDAWEDFNSLGNKILDLKGSTESKLQDLKNETDDKLNTKADRSQVLTNVPEGAKFTDTIATKTSIGLNNVDNIKQASKVEFDAHNHKLSELTEKNYDSLTNKPVLGTAADKDTGVGTGQIPILGSGGKLDDLIIPKIAISETSIVDNQSQMLGLRAEIGDICVRTDLENTFILKKEPANQLANWQELVTPMSPVQSVAGKKGSVTLTKDDVGLNNVENTADIDKPISSKASKALDLKADKTQVLTNVPKGAKFTDTVYNHPSTHPASIIVESATKSFITDIERNNWNSKETPGGAQTKATKALTDAKGYVDSKVKTDVPVDALFTDTIYKHPTTHPASMITESAAKRFVTDVEKAKWNSKASNLTLNELVLGGRFKVVYNDVEDSLDFEVI